MITGFLGLQGVLRLWIRSVFAMVRKSSQLRSSGSVGIHAGVLLTAIFTLTAAASGRSFEFPDHTASTGWYLQVRRARGPYFNRKY
jgi:hypothetical protein